MIKHTPELNAEKLFELVQEDDLNGLVEFFKVLKQKEETKEKNKHKIGKFADFLDLPGFPDYDLNKVYKNNKTLVMMACDNSNLEMIKLLVDNGAALA